MKSSEVRSRVMMLRNKGNSYSYISGLTGISKSTLSCWLSAVSYSPNSQTKKRIDMARISSGKYKHGLKQESFRKATILARRDIGRINQRDLFMLGLGVYIGEGMKSGDQVRIINSNPAIIKLSIRWFKEICGVDDTNFRMRLHIYPDNDEGQCIRYWSRVTGLPKRIFQKTQIDRRKDKKMAKRGKLPFGTAHLRIKSNGRKEFGVFLGRRIRAWMDTVLRV